MRVLLLIAMACSGLIWQIATPSPEPFSCPVTIRDNQRPPKAMDPFTDDDHTIYDDGIWVSIPADGMLILTPDDELGFHSLEGWRSSTFTWMRADGVEGKVIVSGKRLDKHSTDSPRTPLSPDRQYVNSGFVRTGIAFSSSGCWEVTGTVGEHQIIWVMDVRFENAVAMSKPQTKLLRSGLAIGIMQLGTTSTTGE